MTETATVEIPDDVRDNSPHTVRFQWRGVVTEELTDRDLEMARTTFGYTVYRWHDVAPDGQRVTLTRMDNAKGHNVWFYGTYHFTRVACAECACSYASVYQVITAKGDTSDPVPRCDQHADRFRRAIAGEPGIVLTESEPLRIRQHD